MLTESADQAGTSIWRRSLPPAEQESPGGGRIEDVDLAVIGGGFTGLSAAYHALAANPGMRVVLLEGERIGHGASSRNTGMLTPGVGQNLAAQVKRFGADAARAMYERSLQAVAYVGELADREQIDAGLRMTGQLVIAHGRLGSAAPRRASRPDGIARAPLRAPRRKRPARSASAWQPSPRGARPRGRRRCACPWRESSTRAASSRASARR